MKREACRDNTRGAQQPPIILHMLRKKAAVVTARILSSDGIPQRAPFCRLPLEIRELIYDLIFGESIVDVHQKNGPCCKQPSPSPKTFGIWSRPNLKTFEIYSRIQRNIYKRPQELKTFRSKPSPLAIRATCRQLGCEATNVWYRNSIFWFYSVPCMTLFLEEMGDSGRDAIRHVGCGARWGPKNEVNKEILRMLRSFASLRSLTIEDANCTFDTLSYDHSSEALEALWNLWKDEAHNLLRLGNHLERIVFTNKWLTVRPTVEDPDVIEVRESKELKINRRTGEFSTVTSSVERDISKLESRWSKLCLRDGVGSVLRIGTSTIDDPALW
jgi:hypothetical protein